MCILILTRNYVIVVQGPLGGQRDPLSHKVLSFTLTHQCPGLQRMLALLSAEFIQADSLSQKRPLCLVHAPLCASRYFFIQNCSGAFKICYHAGRDAASFLSFWMIHQLPLFFRHDIE